MSSYSIYLKQPLSNIPSHYYDNGFVYLDLPLGFNLSLWNAPTKTKLDGFSEVAIMQGDLPSTPKNDYILALYNDVNFLSADYTKGIDVVVVNGAIVLPQQTLNIESYSKAGRKYSFSLVYSSGDIVTKLKETKLCDLFAGVELRLEIDAIFASMDIEQYNSSTDVCYPVQNYGRFYYLDKTSYAGLLINAVEFRPNLFAAAVFKRAFCGYNLEGSFVGTAFFNKLITYNLRPDYDMAFAERRKFLASRSPYLVAQGNFNLLELVVDSSLPQTYGLDWNNTTHSFGINRHGVYSFSLRMRTTGRVTAHIVKNGTVLNSISVLDDTRVLTVDVVELLPSDSIWVEVIGFNTPGGGNGILQSVSFTNTPIKDTTPYEGEIFTLKEALDQDITAYDYIKGISDAFDLNYVINRAKGTIGIYPESGNEVYGESYQSILNPNLPPLDWSDKSEPNTLDIRFPKENKAVKDVTAKWKDATDKYITEVINPSQELFSYYELINGGGSENITFENKLFEPTATDKYYWVDGNLAYLPNIPLLIDNQNNQKSYNLGHRILYLVGKVSQSTITRYLSEIQSPMAVDSFSFSFATMFYNKPLLNAGLNYSFILEQNLTFDKLPKNLYTTFLKSSVQDKIENVEFDKPILLSREDFLTFDFTQNVVVRSQKNQVLCKVKMIKDFSLLKQGYTLITLEPYKTRC